MPVRAILDANVYISYLLKPEPGGTVAQIFERIFARQVQVIVPGLVIQELKEVVERKAYLSQRIPVDEIDLLAEQLRQIGEATDIDRTGQAIAIRDPNDLYLLEAAVDSDADFLVTRDKDLLALASHLQRPQIVTPFEFLVLLES